MPGCSFQTGSARLGASFLSSGMTRQAARSPTRNWGCCGLGAAVWFAAA